MKILSDKTFKEKDTLFKEARDYALKLAEENDKLKVELKDKDFLIESYRRCEEATNKERAEFRTYRSEFINLMVLYDGCIEYSQGDMTLSFSPRIKLAEGYDLNFAAQVFEQIRPPDYSFSIGPENSFRFTKLLWDFRPFEGLAKIPEVEKEIQGIYDKAVSAAKYTKAIAPPELPAPKEKK